MQRSWVRTRGPRRGREWRVSNYTDLTGQPSPLEQRIVALQDELAALKEQYCDECEHENYCAVLAAAYEEFNDLGDGGRDFSCNRWTERGAK